ncbi:SO2930 family diheme c-type cytochrome [Tsuneonella suprasediminis]|uniref:SO2930 family diheme c-type cytochrome n=1 Tax=Tsuneonella suprasediminis TaxID=2306996 RepID=UPI001F0C6E8E|nr:SO2930 family diheme c-type cytochrome [Tsuneonella suprasediminis]
MIRSLVFGAALVTAAVAFAASPKPAAVNDVAIAEAGLPRTLSEYGFFTDAAAQIPAVRVTPYRLNTPLWSNGAEKLRFVYVPKGTQAKADGEGLIDLPVGAALIKTFAFQKDGKRHLIETRVLLHRADGWLALPYVWNDEQTEAKLAVAGARLPVTTPAGEAIDYRVPNKNQCKECHGLNGAVIPIGPKARNLSADWLDRFADAGMIDTVPAVAHRLPVWEDRASAPAEAAARGYLDANCAHCHRPGATASNSGLDLRWEQSDPHAIGIMKHPVAAGRGAGNLLYDIVPGKPDQSILTYRMASSEAGVAMPELGKATVDRDGLAVVERWIAALPQMDAARAGH